MMTDNMKQMEAVMETFCTAIITMAGTPKAGMAMVLEKLSDRIMALRISESTKTELMMDIAVLVILLDFDRVA